MPKGLTGIQRTTDWSIARAIKRGGRIRAGRGKTVSCVEVIRLPGTKGGRKSGRPPFQQSEHPFLIASANRELFVVDFHISYRKGADLIFCHDKRAVDTQEIIPGQQLFDSAEGEIL